MQAAFLQSKFEAGLNWDSYLATDASKADRWMEIYNQVSLNDSQRSLLGGFTRQIKALCVSGIWCGDCVQQGPLIQRIAEATDCIDLRWADRDANADLAEQLKINAGMRVPVLVLMAEDCELVSIAGDRTLTRYRAMAAKQLGGACPMPGAPVPQDELDGTMQDWLDEIERVHLLLRLSGRFRQKYGD